MLETFEWYSFVSNGYLDLIGDDANITRLGDQVFASFLSVFRIKIA